jgi:hypothetical protein
MSRPATTQSTALYPEPGVVGHRSARGAPLQAGKPRPGGTRIGFYSLLRLFPAIAPLVTTYDLIFDPTQIQAQFDDLGSVLHDHVDGLISAELESATDTRQQALGFGLAGALLPSAATTRPMALLAPSS